MANTYGKVSGTFEEVTNIYGKVSGTWQEVDEAYAKVSGTWEQVFAAFVATSFVTLSSGSSTFVVPQWSECNYMFKQQWVVEVVQPEELIMIKQVENQLEQVEDQELIYQIKYLQ
jgi:hypothetical protein